MESFTPTELQLHQQFWVQLNLAQPAQEGKEWGSN